MFSGTPRANSRCQSADLRRACVKARLSTSIPGGNVCTSPRNALTRKRRSTSRESADVRRMSRSLNIAARSHASRGAPNSRALTSMCAKRGCAPSLASARPWDVMRAAASIASNCRNRSRACASGAAGGGSSQLKVAASVAPQQASSKANGARSACVISGAVCGANDDCEPSDHKR